MMMRHLTKRTIDAAKVISGVSHSGAGGVVLFLGTVRDNSEFGKVDLIDYEAYEQMAEKKLQQIEEDARVSWPESRISLVHRTGRLKVGDVSVAVAASAPHRAEAFEACRYAIERIKHDVPIWKKERLADGTSRWVEGKRIETRTKRRRRATTS
jgi:molybdopterin synthase catalytic subunit